MIFCAQPVCGLCDGRRGEGAFGLLLRSFTDEGINPDAIEGLSYRKNGEIHASTSFRLVKELDTVPSPYTRKCLKPLATE